MHSAEFSIVQSESDGPMRGRLQEMPEGRYDNLHDILHPKRRTRHRDAIACAVWLLIEAAGPDDHALVASNRSFQPAAQKFLRDISLSLCSNSHFGFSVDFWGHCPRTGMAGRCGGGQEGAAAAL
jgi:hypothetical protein